jgi:hypothetical protein
MVLARVRPAAIDEGHWSRGGAVLERCGLLRRLLGPDRSEPLGLPWSAGCALTRSNFPSWGPDPFGVVAVDELADHRVDPAALPTTQRGWRSSALDLEQFPGASISMSLLNCGPGSSWRSRRLRWDLCPATGCPVFVVRAWLICLIRWAVGKRAAGAPRPSGASVALRRSSGPPARPAGRAGSGRLPPARRQGPAAPRPGRGGRSAPGPGGGSAAGWRSPPYSALAAGRRGRGC